jgi:hypothetical protein
MRKKPRASAAAAAKAIAESQPSMYDSDLENDENAALVGSAVEAWSARRVERQGRIEEWFDADEKVRAPLAGLAAGLCKVLTSPSL